MVFQSLGNIRHAPEGVCYAPSQSTDSGNRLTTDGTFDYVYDYEGNMISQTDLSTDNVTEFTWDHRNRLTRLVVIDGTTAEVLFEQNYKYDVLNRRIGVWTDDDGDGSNPGEQLWTAYDGANAWADMDGQGNVLTRYLNGREMDQRFAPYDVNSEKTAFYLTDNINSVRQIAQIDNSTPVIYWANYTAFGMIASQSGAGGDRFKFTGRELDASGLYYYRARYYGAGVGRFVSEDPIGFAAGDPNLYRYVGNQSNSLTDPSGNIPILIPGIIAIGVILIGAGKNEVEVGAIAVGAGPALRGAQFVCRCAGNWLAGLGAVAATDPGHARILGDWFKGLTNLPFNPKNLDLVRWYQQKAIEIIAKYAEKGGECSHIPQDRLLDKIAEQRRRLELIDQWLRAHGQIR